LVLTSVTSAPRLVFDRRMRRRTQNRSATPHAAARWQQRSRWRLSSLVDPVSRATRREACVLVSFSTSSDPRPST